MSTIRVLLADDHEIVRSGLRMLVESQPDMTVVGEAADGNAAVAEVDRAAPNVVVMDVSMPGLNGLEATKQIVANAPHTPVLALSRYSDTSYVRQLFGAGAAGYVLKQSAATELIRAIRAVAGGSDYLDSSFRREEIFPGYVTSHKPLDRITTREAEVLRLIALGCSNKEIAQRLDISVKTVEAHKANGMRKLELSGRAEVVRFALLHGWLSDP